MRLLYIEDDPILQKIVQFNFEKLDYEVTIESDGKQGLDLALSQDFDLILIDWMLPSLSGLEICQKLRQRGCKSIIIIVTARDDENSLIEALNSGADDFLYKPFAQKELNGRIKAHLIKNNQTVYSYKEYSFNLINKELMINNKPIKLTNKEFDLLLFLIKQPDVYQSRSEILKAIWNYDYDQETRVVDICISKIKNKLQDYDQINSKRGVGYCFTSKKEI